MTTITGNRPHGAPCWFDIGVPDIRQAIDFYSAVFGWQITEGAAETGHYSMCLAGGRRVAALALGQGSDHWWNVYFASDDVDVTAKQITDGGGTIVIPPTDVMDQGRMVTAKDPSGAQFGLWHGLAHHGIEVVNEPGAMCWAELSTADSATARAFYATVLDRPVRDSEVPDMDYATVKVDGTDVAGIWGTQVERAHWTVYFAVDDTDAAVSRVTAGGGRVVGAAKDSPYGRFAVVSDPFGAEFAVLRPPQG